MLPIQHAEKILYSVEIGLGLSEIGHHQRLVNCGEGKVKCNLVGSVEHTGEPVKRTHVTIRHHNPIQGEAIVVSRRCFIA